MTREQYLAAIYKLDTDFSEANKGPEMPWGELVATLFSGHGNGITNVLAMYPQDARKKILDKLCEVILEQAQKHGGALGVIGRGTEIRVVVDNDL